MLRQSSPRAQGLLTLNQVQVLREPFRAFSALVLACSKCLLLSRLALRLALPSSQTRHPVLPESASPPLAAAHVSRLPGSPSFSLTFAPPHGLDATSHKSPSASQERNGHFPSSRPPLHSVGSCFVSQRFPPRETGAALPSLLVWGELPNSRDFTSFFLGGGGERVGEHGTISAVAAACCLRDGRGSGDAGPRPMGKVTTMCLRAAQEAEQDGEGAALVRLGLCKGRLGRAS